MTRLFLLPLVLLAFAGPVRAAPSAELWDFWLPQGERRASDATHTVWEQLLKDHVRRLDDGSTRFDYAGMDAADRNALAAYISELEQFDVHGLDRPSQLAYWINLYNALTVQVILAEYPVASILDIDISPGLFSNGPWGARLVTVMGQQLSLDDIEHRILRPIWKDPRIHYAVNCASIGCPDLGTYPVSAENAEDYLEAAARAFINHPRGVRVKSGKLYVSSIYDWFSEDFGQSDGEVIEHLKRYASPELKAQLEGITRISGDSYDWDLNDLAAP